MSDDLNPYQPPRRGPDLPGGQREPQQNDIPRSLPAGQGWRWITEGFELFRRQPGTWIVLLAVWLVILIGLSLLPMLSLASYILSPIFTAGVMLGCRAQDHGKNLELSHLFAGFKEHTGQLALVGLLYLLAVMAAVILAGAIAVTFIGSGTVEAIAGGSVPSDIPAGAIGTVVLLVLLLIVPIAMAYWFAPALIVFDEVTAVEAMKRSFAGCLRNIGAFLIYGLIGMVLSVLAAIPFGLGFLILGPVLIASMYVGCRDIFAPQQPARPEQTSIVN